MLTLKLPPGLFKNGTTYESKGRFYEADLWRWFDGAQRPIGGWRQKGTASVAGVARAITTWRDNDNAVWIGIGTNSNLYAMSRSGSLTDITPAGFTTGSVDATTGGGYGSGLYGKGLYGQPTVDSTNVIAASMWTLDTFGENLIGCFGGVIYEWVPDTGTDAIAVTNAPTAEAIVTTEERSIFALGAGGDPRKVAWCDLENNTDWTPGSTDQAGAKRLVTGGKLLCGHRVKGGVLVFTDADVHRAEYVGLPQVYRFERLATGCGPISKGSVVVTGDDRAIWMGINGFWQYNGAVSPLESDLSDYLYRNLNTLQASKVTTMHNSAFGEVWWMYPSASATECDRVVVYNYREGHWNDFALNRLSGVDRSVLPYPLMVSTAGAVYEHEAGNARDGRQPYALCGPIEMGDGERMMTVHAIIPDELNTGDVAVSFVVSDWTMDANETFGPFSPLSKTDCFFTGRRVAPKFIADADKDFRVGAFRFDVRNGPRR